MRVYSVPYIDSTCFSTLVPSLPTKGRRSREFWHHQNPREPVMGIEPMTTVLPRLCATAAPHGPVIYRWAVRDSNPRSRRQLIYSQPHLATLVTAQDEKLSPDTITPTLPTPPEVEPEQPNEECRRRDSKTCYFRHKEHAPVPPE